MKKAILLLSFAMIFGCSKPNKANVEKQPTETSTLNSSDSAKQSAESKISKDQILKDLNTEILKALAQKNYAKFSTFIHPEKGVRFSMYAHVNPKTDKVFTRENFKKYIDTRTKFTWGSRDGTGEIYVASLGEYLADWVYKRDFAESEFYLNEFKGRGNSLNNLKKIYPNADFTENYIAGSKKYSFMDWNSLRMVFEKFQGKYFLIAIVNDQWTI